MAYDSRGIPIIGDDIYQVGQVVDILADPCSPVPSILVKAFFSYIPHLVWAIAKPDPIDYAIDRFGRPHKKIRRRKFPIHSYERPKMPVPPGWATVEFRGIHLLERIGFYFLIVDATTDFLVNWTSMAYEFSGCTVEGTHYASTRQNGIKELNNTSGVVQLSAFDDQVMNTWLATTNAIIKTTVGPGMVYGGFTQVPERFGRKQMSVSRSWLRRDGSGPYQEIDLTVTKDNKGNGNIRGGKKIWNTLDGTATYTLWAEGTDGWLTYQDAFITGSGTLDPGFKADP